MGNGPRASFLISRERVTVRTGSFAKAAGFLLLSAALVVGYLFLLQVFRGKLGPLSAAVPAIVLA